MEQEILVKQICMKALILLSMYTGDRILSRGFHVSNTLSAFDFFSSFKPFKSRTVKLDLLLFRLFIYDYIQNHFNDCHSSQ